MRYVILALRSNSIRTMRSAKANYKALAQELERIGAQMALAGKPSFDSRQRTASGREGDLHQSALADLDREISASKCQGGQRRRDATTRAPPASCSTNRMTLSSTAMPPFGRPDYDLQKAMRERLEHLEALEKN